MWKQISLMNIWNDVIVNKTSAGFRNFGYFWTISFFEFLSMSGHNSSIHPFIWCITIKPVALCIIRNTWSVTALRSLHTIVSEEGDHQACEKEEILKKIMDKIEVLTDVPLFTKSWTLRIVESYLPFSHRILWTPCTAGAFRVVFSKWLTARNDHDRLVSGGKYKVMHVVHARVHQRGVRRVRGGLDVRRRNPGRKDCR